MNIQEYIESGILETYVLGSATEAETMELLRLKEQHPQIKNALDTIEADLEFMAGIMSITPPPEIWNRISDSIDDLIVAPKVKPLRLMPDREEERKTSTGNTNKFIEVEFLDSHMRVHKAWKWVFAAVFVLSKVFLATAIYFYLENRQAQQQIQDLKTELRQAKQPVGR